jgi:hypothetical protein
MLELAGSIETSSERDREIDLQSWIATAPSLAT